MKLIELCEIINEVRIADLTKRQKEIIRDLIKKSKPDANDSPTVAIPKDRSGIENPMFADLELRGIVTTGKAGDVITIIPTRSAVVYFKMKEKKHNFMEAVEGQIAIGHATIWSIRHGNWLDANLDKLRGLIKGQIPDIVLSFHTRYLPGHRTGWNSAVDVIWASTKPEQVFDRMRVALFDSEDFDLVKGGRQPFRYYMVPLTKSGIMDGMGHFMGMYYVRMAYDEMAGEIKALGLEIADAR